MKTHNITIELTVTTEEPSHVTVNDLVETLWQQIPETVFIKAELVKIETQLVKERSHHAH